MYMILFIFSLFALALTFWAQVRVKGSFNKWSKQMASSQKTGAQVAREILDHHGLSHVPVEMVPGKLSDHYDPVSKKVRLSENVYHDRSIAAISIAAHECGHALQHQESYGMLVLRHRMFPIVNFTSGIAPFLLLGGLLFQMMGMFALGILFFAASVAFQVVTLPVEFNASSRAKEILVRDGFIRSNESRGVDKMLNAAALTYVAAALYAVAELARFIFLFLAAQNDD